MTRGLVSFCANYAKITKVHSLINKITLKRQLRPLLSCLHVATAVVNKRSPGNEVTWASPFEGTVQCHKLCWCKIAFLYELKLHFHGAHLT